MIWQLLVCSGSIATNVWIGATTVGEVISLVARETAINKDKTHTRTAIQCMGFEKSVLIVPQCGLKKAIITLQTNLFKGGFISAK